MAVVEHDEVAFEQKRPVREPDKAGGGCGHRGTGGCGDVDPEVGRFWYAAENALRSINAADPPVRRPGERLGPAQLVAIPGAGVADFAEFDRTAGVIDRVGRRVGRRLPQRRDRFDIVLTARNGDDPNVAATVGEGGDQGRFRRGIAPEPGEKAPVARQSDGGTVDRDPHRTRRRRAEDYAALRQPPGDQPFTGRQGLGTRRRRRHNERRDQDRRPHFQGHPARNPKAAPKRALRRTA